MGGGVFFFLGSVLIIPPRYSLSGNNWTPPKPFLHCSPALLCFPPSFAGRLTMTQTSVLPPHTRTLFIRVDSSGGGGGTREECGGGERGGDHLNSPVSREVEVVFNRPCGALQQFVSRDDDLRAASCRLMRSWPPLVLYR